MSEYSSSAPYIRTSHTIRRINWTVSASLAPVLVVAYRNWGFTALWTVVLSIFFSVIFELGENILTRRKTIYNGSAVLTGLLFSLCVPPAFPWYGIAAGTFCAIILSKAAFGGLGKNRFNPALLGRFTVFALFPQFFSSYPQSRHGIDALSSATPLTQLQSGGMATLTDSVDSMAHLYKTLFIGNYGGSIGEVSVLAILVGGLFLLFKGYIFWRIPAAYIGSLALFSWVLGGNERIFSGDALIHIMSGGTMICAFFIATDYVTSPILPFPRILYGSIAGALTFLIRRYSPYPEGAMYAILLLNPFSVHLDRIEQWRLHAIPFKTSKILRPSGFVGSGYRALLSMFTWGVFFLIIFQLGYPSFEQWLSIRRQGIERQQKIVREIEQIFPDAEIVKKGDWISHEESLPWFEVTQNGQFSGHAIVSIGKGYKGPITVLVTIRKGGPIHTVSILSQHETNRLGSRITEKSFLEQFSGKSKEQLSAGKRNGDNDPAIIAITAATISSRAVAEDAVKSAIMYLEKRLGDSF